LRRLLFLVGFCLSLTGTSALAQPSPSSETDGRGRIHFDAGNSYYERGAYEDAIREFQLSYSLSQRPELLFNLYSAYERLGRFVEAESLLARYAASDISADQRRVANARLESLRERMRTEEPHEPPAAEADIERGLGGARKGAIALWAIGAAGFIDFAAFAVLSSSESNELAACSPTCDDEEVSNLRTYNILADVGLAVGVAGVLAGTVLWIVGKPSPVSVTVDQEGAALQFTARF
jgi:tetratricopeptide (TPR) repeat protein